ncbi:MAG: hypothetical protein IJ328_01800 [Muribaculaceae bacterium]|nr:hypothetical protein [Muribaculaceae bacterium]
MKESISFPAHAGGLQSSIDWKQVTKTATRIAGRTVNDIIRHEATPWVLTAIAVMAMCYGFATGCDMLYKSCAVVSIFPFAWGLLNEFKNSNTDEL